jgi:hypothetical protein
LIFGPAFKTHTWVSPAGSVGGVKGSLIITQLKLTLHSETAVNGGSELLIFVQRAAQSHDMSQSFKSIRETGCGGAVDVKCAAEAQGWTLRQIGAELGVPWTAVSHQT